MVLFTTDAVLLPCRSNSSLCILNAPSPVSKRCDVFRTIHHPSKVIRTKDSSLFPQRGREIPSCDLLLSFGLRKPNSLSGLSLVNRRVSPFEKVVGGRGRKKQRTEELRRGRGEQFLLVIQSSGSLRAPSYFTPTLCVNKIEGGGLNVKLVKVCRVQKSDSIERSCLPPRLTFRESSGWAGAEETEDGRIKKRTRGAISARYPVIRFFKSSELLHTDPLCE
ncbi:hypothetical protein CDAR_477881 [Caerostris darwini]|uniref:Uncharacterized protein n=1 Tax=Caerostris darwini TaxID=1538125 RepID=A0AAV4Q1Y8_9ARAC|nr:hypothetical protein CDAR_477881 [Caerostris darwini]